MVRASRYLYFALSWLTVVGLVAQVFLIGQGMLGGDPSGTALHRNLGWLVHLIPIAVLPFAYLSRAGARHWQWALASAVLVFLVPIFVGLRTVMPVLGALHPVAAVLAFPLAVVVAINAWRALRAPLPATEAAGG